jgi:hypothetical protein
VRKGDDLTTFTVPKVMKNPEALTFRIPKGLFRPVAGNFTFTFTLVVQMFYPVQLMKLKKPRSGTQRLISLSSQSI